MKQPVLTFDAATHRYQINGRPVPGVTDILAAVLGRQWNADPWYMGLGTANHACYALLAAGKPFEPAPESRPYVDAWQRWAEKHHVVPLAWEGPVCSEMLQYAGTMDLVAVVDGKRCIVDYKGSIDDRVQWQLAAYSLAYTETQPIKLGLAVEFDPSGGPAKMRWFDLRLPIQEWKCIRTVYGLKQRLGDTDKEMTK